MFPTELLQKPQIVFKEESYIVYAVLEHGYPLYTEAEGEAGVLPGVVSHGPEDLGVYHAGAEDLEPARALADPAPRVVGAADDAAYVHFGARLGKGEEARPEPYRGLFAGEPAGEQGQHALKAAKGDAPVHQAAP